jgi:hypothetical protein
MKVHRIASGIMPALPAPNYFNPHATTTRVLQGGLPPVPYRASTPRWGNGNVQHSPVRNKNAKPVSNKVQWVKLPKGSLIAWSAFD